jgi:hypothetical protein
VGAVTLRVRRRRGTVALAMGDQCGLADPRGDRGGVADMDHERTAADRGAVDPFRRRTQIVSVPPSPASRRLCTEVRAHRLASGGKASPGRVSSVNVAYGIAYDIVVASHSTCGHCGDCPHLPCGPSRFDYLRDMGVRAIYLFIMG